MLGVSALGAGRIPRPPMGDDEAEPYWRLWTAIRKVVAAADPEAPRS
jgi:hypothetical protein